MNVYRTDVSPTRENFYNQFVGIMHTLNWDHDNIDGDNAKFYINATQYIDVTLSRNAPAAIAIAIYNGENKVTTLFSSSYMYANASVYVNGDAMAMSFQSTNNAITTYSYAATIIIDKVGDIVSMIYGLLSGDSASVLNTTANNLPVYKSFRSSSISNHTNTAQIARYIDVVSGNAYNNLYCILLTPWNNTIVDKSGEKYLFTSGFAIPCGAEINYHYYE